MAPEDYQAKFEAEWEKVSGTAYRVAEADHLEAVFQKILMLDGKHAVVLSRNPLLSELNIAERLEAAGKFVTSWVEKSVARGTQSLPDYSKSAFAARAGITGVDYVVAETGTLVLSSATEGVQIASLAPPIHIALYRRSQLVGSLDEVFAKLAIARSGDQPSPGRSFVFVTGTSRTADIEQILIHGVHGPGEAHAILVEDGCC
jgi:L-lactate utilization protein LutC